MINFFFWGGGGAKKKIGLSRMIFRDSGANILCETRLFPSEVETLPCADHRMNSIFPTMFQEDDLKIEKSGKGFIFLVRVQNEDKSTSSHFEEICEKNMMRLNL